MAFSGAVTVEEVLVAAVESDPVGEDALVSLLDTEELLNEVLKRLDSGVVVVRGEEATDVLS